VPIVPAAVIFDLAVGAPTWPDADAGEAAIDTATPLNALDTARSRRQRRDDRRRAGPAGRRPGGFVAAQVRFDEGNGFCARGGKRLWDARSRGRG